MKDWESIKKKIDINFDNQVKALRELLSFKSVLGEAVTAEGKDMGPDTVTSEGKAYLPFGKETHRAFEYMLARGRGSGFDTVNIDNYGGHIEFPGFEKDEEGDPAGEAAETVGIACHLDVVPEGSGWDHDPFGGEISEGRIYGRGTVDDKGPAVAALFAMKALDEAGVVPDRNIRLILGLDEETGWNGMTYYNERVPEPDMGFTPDGDFPVIYGEKGIIEFEIAKKFAKTTAEGLELRSFRGGVAANMVADSARVVVNSKKTGLYDKIKDRAEEYKEKGVDIRCRNMGKNLEITVAGKAAHGSKPWEGVNAVSLMMDFLSGVDFANDDINEFIEFYNKHIGTETDGSSLGCRMEDTESGKTVVNMGIIDMQPKAARLTLGIRFPVTKTMEEIYDSMMPVLDGYGLGLIKRKYIKPIFKAKDSFLISRLMDVYRDNTGDMESEPLVIGGGTYARAFENMVAFGCRFPGQPSLEHQKNEYISLENFKKITVMIADAMYRLACDQERTDRCGSENE